MPDLLPEEAALLSPRVVERRRTDFAIGRAAAHRALGALGLAAAVVGRGERGDPLWPAGVVGSITHASGVAVAAVAARQHTAGIGVDLEVVDPSRLSSIASYVCLPDELTWVDGSLVRLTMLFSAKEAVYKALYPTIQAILEFTDVRLAWLSPAAFEATLLRPAGPYQAGLVIPGRCNTDDGRVFTGAWLAS